MPFTLAHPAAIIPLQKLMGKRASLSALVIGSMIADLPLFVGGVPGSFSHSAPGLLAYCLPAGLLVYLLFHGLLKLPTIALLPRAITARLPAEALQRWPAVPPGTVISSIGLGALSHLAWDGFTHQDTLIAQHLPVLHVFVGTLHGTQFHVYSVLQYLSSIVGLLALAWWGSCRASAVRADHGIGIGLTLPFGIRCLAVVAIVAAGLTATFAGVPAYVDSLDALIYHVLVSGMQGAGAAWIACCIGWHAFAERALSGHAASA